MSVDWFVMIVDGVEIVVYCSPWPMPPQSLAMVYEQAMIGKVARSSLSNAPTNIGEVREIVKTVKNNPASGWVVGSLHLQPEDFDVLQNNYRRGWSLVIKKCECGAEKCGSQVHSSWCPRATS